MRYSILFLFTVATIMCCKNKSASTSTSDQVVVEIPEDFPAFYQKFHEDSLYQMAHIVFPLGGQSDSTSWQKDQWIMHKPFDNTTGEFNRSLDNFAEIITETIAHNQPGMFKMVRRFSKLNGEWNLIYYKVQAMQLGDPETMQEEG